MKKRIYYAHCMAEYDTKQEQEHVKTLEDMGYHVVNPNSRGMDWMVKTMKEQGKTSSDIMDFFVTIVEKCDELAFATTADNKVSAGVHKEIKVMLSLSRPVFQLPTFSSLEVMSVAETKKYLRSSS